MNTPTTSPPRPLFPAAYRTAFTYGALIYGMILLIWLVVLPLTAIFKNPLLSITIATVMITANTFCAWHTGGLWHTHRTTAIFLGAMTALIGAVLTLGMLATPYLYTHAESGYSLLGTLALTRSSAWIAPLLYALYHLAVTTLAIHTSHHTSHHTTKNNHPRNQQTDTHETVN